ncbi:MAG TPA: ATP-binding cassette domain-containing protein, partial [Candidatus Methanomethylia archaeon]|nr:ATP-binding cassette domain-containing protein [Candidatus Methanomethylicia archaeon]
MDPRIVYEDVKKAFDGKVVLDGVSFKVNRGELAVLLGPNGSGKSTLFKMALGLVKPDSGRILINGLDASQNPLEARKLVGFI